MRAVTDIDNYGQIPFPSFLLSVFYIAYYYSRIFHITGINFGKNMNSENQVSYAQKESYQGTVWSEKHDKEYRWAKNAILSLAFLSLWLHGVQIELRWTCRRTYDLYSLLFLSFFLKKKLIEESIDKLYS